MPSLADPQQERLFKVARLTIDSWLRNKKRISLADLAEKDEALLRKRATFVTLTIRGKLRGCVGSIIPYQPLVFDVSQNAFHAAFQDTRFYPLSLEEWKETEIEISLLTEPVMIHVQDWQDLFRQLRPGTDGVIIHRSSYQATFLPQVWESLPTKEEFMEALCQKAGLHRNAYKTDTSEMSFYLYQAEILEEPKSPSPQ